MAAFAPYQVARRCTGKAQPGVRALTAFITAIFPGASNGGIYVCRSVRGASRAYSLHAEGRAVDIRVRSIANGDRIVNTLLPIVGRLGIQMIIFNRRIWSNASPQGKRYNGVNPHREHIHIELGWPAALRLNVAAIRAVLAGKVSANRPSGDRGPQGAFPLPLGHWYGPNDRTVKSHSGYFSRDRLAILAIQREIGVPQSGVFDARTIAAASKWKLRYGQPGDPLVGLATWNLMKVK